MKKRQATKKLSLNKQTIANLNKQQMNSILGGDDGGNDSVGANNQVPCDEHLSIFKPEACAGLPKHSSVCPPPESTQCNT